MTITTLDSIDLQSLSKSKLVELCEEIREETGINIDLRSNCSTLIKYINNYKNETTLPLFRNVKVMVDTPLSGLY